MPFDIFIWGWKSELLWLAEWSELNRIYYSPVLFLLKNVTKLRIRISRQKYKAPFSQKMDDGTPSQTRMLSSSYPIPKREMWATKSLFRIGFFPSLRTQFMLLLHFQFVPNAYFSRTKNDIAFWRRSDLFFCPVTASLKYYIFHSVYPGYWAVGLPKISGPIFNVHPWVWPKSWMYTKFRVPRSMF